MNREINYQITEKDNEKTILYFLQEQGYSRNVIIHLKKTPESILKNGVWSYVNEILRTGDTLSIKIIENESSPKIIPVPLPLEIVYEDEDILVVNKPADMPIHPSMNNYGNTLANAVMWHFSRQNISYTFRCINRLDRDTTGLTILAKNMLSAGILSNRMKKRQIHKEYRAICAGIVPDKGTICAPIARAAESTIERCVDFERGEQAVTHFELEKTDGQFSLVKLTLETGRTHQIRVHMKYIGHPLIGDFLYNPDDTTMNRQALHCCCLRFMHPITNEMMVFEAPLPEDMKKIFIGT